jgi:hypothetical protein
MQKKKDRVIENFDILSPITSILKFIFSPITNLFNSFAHYCYICCLICCCICFAPMLIGMLKGLTGSGASHDE